jgi:primosomal replication protein N
MKLPSVACCTCLLRYYTTSVQAHTELEARCDLPGQFCCFSVSASCSNQNISEACDTFLTEYWAAEDDSFWYREAPNSAAALMYSIIQREKTPAWQRQSPAGRPGCPTVSEHVSRYGWADYEAAT